MIKEFVKAWDANKDRLSEYIASHDQSCYDNYENIVRMLFDTVINPYMRANGYIPFDISKVHEIDDGDYQGTLVYIIPMKTCQPSPWEYVVTYVFYGSCSGCDTLLSISGYTDGLPNAEQVRDYMTLCLNILQQCKYMFNQED